MALMCSLHGAYPCQAPRGADAWAAGCWGRRPTFGLGQRPPAGGAHGEMGLLGLGQPSDF